MAWYTLEEATTRGPSERAWMQRVLAGEVSSYVDGRGARRVWIEDAAEPSSWQLEGAMLPLGREVSSLRRELKDLRGSVARKAREGSRRLSLLEEQSAAYVRPPAPPPPPLAPRGEVIPLAIQVVEPEPLPEPEPEPEPRTHESLLERVAATWTGSDRELERTAGLPKAFLAKAKKGLRNGPRSAKSWALLEAFLDGPRLRDVA